MKKLITLLLTVLLVGLVTVSVGAVVLDSNDDVLTAEAYGALGNGYNRDTYDTGEAVTVFVQGKVLLPEKHTHYKYEIYYMHKDGEEELIEAAELPLDDYSYENNMLYDSFVLDEKGPYRIRFTLNTGEYIDKGVFFIYHYEPVEPYKKDIEPSHNFKDVEQYEKFIEKHHLN